MTVPEALAEILKRLVRLETRVSKLMLHEGISPSGTPTKSLTEPK